ncbi:MAG: hypothetical protein LIP01_00320 [Tannerellaceae bacterium]|nr:hypothetical protein [Tannerellaceae bacterium]
MNLKKGDGYLAGIHKEIEKKGDKFVRSWQDKFSIMDANGAPNPLGYLQRIDDLTNKAEVFAAQWLEKTEKNNQELINLLKEIAKKQSRTNQKSDSKSGETTITETFVEEKKRSRWEKLKDVFRND